MNACKRCGATMLEGSRFCGRCGTAADAPIKTICPNCKSEVPDGFLFCDKCGSKLGSPGIGYVAGPSSAKTITVSREAQFQCVANTYKVIVNGNVLGNVAAGKSLSANVTSDMATVEIICTTIMINSKLKLVLRLGQNPVVSFKVQWPGTIDAAVNDAEILERVTNY